MFEKRVSVKEDIPDDCREVLVCVDKNVYIDGKPYRYRFVEKAMFSSEEHTHGWWAANRVWKVFDDGFVKIDDPVTHWTPLPGLPEE